jgi:hypothetical protein
MPQDRIVVVVPAGPWDDTADTLRSVLCYLTPERVLVIDDTRGRGIGISDPLIEVFTPPDAPAGVYGGLFVKESAALRHLADTAEFDILLRLDADALILGTGVAKLAAERFASDQSLGALGAYRVGPDGRERDWTPAATLIKAAAGPLGLRHPAARRRIRQLVAGAREHGYTLGEHALGAAVFFRGDTIRDMHRRGMLNYPELARAHIGDDHILGLLVVAAGYRIGDFGGPGDPLAVRWHGLPAAPEDLLAAGKLITHSVRSWAQMPEAEIRGYFAAHRPGI